MSANNVNPYTELDLGRTVRGLVPGQKVLKRYTLERVLGRGGMGVVWLAYDEVLTRKVALKFLPEFLGTDRTALEELKREAKRSLELAHPNIVRFYDFLQDETCVGISMEYVSGDSLANLRLNEPNKVFEVADIQNWVRQLCQALQYAHEEVQIVHRDLKPANLMVDGQGRLKVTDFGIARSVSDNVNRATMQHKGGVAGTLVYMGPQQAMGGAPSIQDDIYSMGATLYELLTSKPPFFSGPSEAILAQIREKTPPPMQLRRRELHTEGKKIPQNWERTIAACLLKDAEKRPASAWEVLERLGLELRGPRGPMPAKVATPHPPEQETTVAETPSPAEEGDPSRQADGAKPSLPEKKTDQPRKRMGNRAAGMMIEIETEIGGILPESEEPKNRPSTAKPPGTKPDATPGKSTTLPPAMESPVPAKPAAPEKPPGRPTTPPGTAKPAKPATGYSLEDAPPATGDLHKPTAARAAAAPTDFKAPATARPVSPLPHVPKPASAAGNLASASAPSTSVPATRPPGTSAPATRPPGTTFRPLSEAPKTTPPPPDVSKPAELELMPPEPPPSAKQEPPAEVPEAPILDLLPVVPREEPVAAAAPAPAFAPEEERVATTSKTAPDEKDYAMEEEEPPRAPRSRKWLKIVAGLAVFGLVASVVVFVVMGIQKKRNPPGKLTVEITSVEADPAGATVVLWQENQVVTNLSGSSEITGLLPGNYTLVVSNASFEVVTNPITLIPQSGTSLAQASKIKVPLSLLKGNVDLTVEPDDALIEVESLNTRARMNPVKKSSIGSAQIALPLGEYLVQWSREGYRRQKTNCVVTKDQPFTAKALLIKVFGGMEITTTPPGATYVLTRAAGGETYQGTTPKTVKELPIGHYQLSLDLSNYDLVTITNLEVMEDRIAPVDRLLARSTGILKFEVQPSNALCVLRGLSPLNGESPAVREQKLPTGSYELELSMPGYHPAKYPVTIKNQETSQLGLLTLAPITGNVRVESKPAGAQIVLAGAGLETNVSGGLDVSLPTGTYKVRAHLDGYEPKEETVLVVEGAPTNKAVILQRSKGWVVVTFSPTNATSLVTFSTKQAPSPGQPLLTGETCTNLASGEKVELSTGNYTLTLEDDHYDTLVTNFVVDSGKIHAVGPITLTHFRGGVEIHYSPADASVTLGKPGDSEIDYAATNGGSGLLRVPNNALRIGNYPVQISRPGFVATNFSIEVRAGLVAAPPAILLRRETGRLKLEIPAPEKVQVAISGPVPLLLGESAVAHTNLSRADFDRLDLPSGGYTVWVGAVGYESVTNRVEVTRSGGSVSGNALARCTGSLKLDTVPTGGQLVVRMTRPEAPDAPTVAPITGKAPLPLPALETGEYVVEATMPRTSKWSAEAASTWQVSTNIAITRQKRLEETLVFPFGTVTLETEPPGAKFIFQGPGRSSTNTSPLVLTEFGLGEKAQFTVRRSGYKPTSFLVDGTAGMKPQTNTVLPRIALTPWPGPQKDDLRWTNSLGMPFVRLTDKVFICIWETRVRDYTNFVDGWMVANRDKLKVMGGSEALWGYLPVVMVSWDDANSFCTKLTMGERNRRFISSSHHYRLPTDLEWSAAVALPVKQDEAAGKTPMERSEGSQRVRGYYSWGTNWPPPIGAGNYDGAISYDPYEFMAPVGMFRPNDLGIFDLGGNVWEWCEDMYNNGGDRVVRGNSWNKSSNADYSASFRNYYKPGTKYEDIGFRCVIELGE